MGNIVPFKRKPVDDVERSDPLSQGAGSTPVPSPDLSTISAPLRSASDHLKAIIRQFEGYRAKLRDSLEFHKRCMVATELPSLDEMVRARDELVAVSERQSKTE